jgi:hypothetical protein
MRAIALQLNENCDLSAVFNRSNRKYVIWMSHSGGFATWLHLASNLISLVWLEHLIIFSILLAIAES